MGWLRKSKQTLDDQVAEFNEAQLDRAAKASEKAMRRIAKMGRTEALDHFDAVVIGVDANIQDFRREGRMDSLDDIQLGLIVLGALTDRITSIRKNETGVDS